VQDKLVKTKLRNGKTLDVRGTRRSNRQWEGHGPGQNRGGKKIAMKMESAGPEGKLVGAASPTKSHSARKGGGALLNSGKERTMNPETKAGGVNPSQKTGGARWESGATWPTPPTH